MANQCTIDVLETSHCVCCVLMRVTVPHRDNAVYFATYNGAFEIYDVDPRGDGLDDAMPIGTAKNFNELLEHFVD